MSGEPGEPEAPSSSQNTPPSPISPYVSFDINDILVGVTNTREQINILRGRLDILSGQIPDNTRNQEIRRILRRMADLTSYMQIRGEQEEEESKIEEVIPNATVVVPIDSSDVAVPPAQPANVPEASTVNVLVGREINPPQEVQPSYVSVKTMILAFAEIVYIAIEITDIARVGVTTQEDAKKRAFKILASLIGTLLLTLLVHLFSILYYKLKFKYQNNRFNNRTNIIVAPLGPGVELVDIGSLTDNEQGRGGGDPPEGGDKLEENLEKEKTEAKERLNARLNLRKMKQKIENIFAKKEIFDELKDIKDKKGNKMENEPEFKYLNDVHKLYEQIKNLFTEEKISDEKSVISSTNALIGIVKDVTRPEGYIKKMHEELKQVKKRGGARKNKRKSHRKNKRKSRKTKRKNKRKSRKTKRGHRGKSPRRRRKSKRRKKRTKQRRR